MADQLWAALWCQSQAQKPQATSAVQEGWEARFKHQRLWRPFITILYLWERMPPTLKWLSKPFTESSRGLFGLVSLSDSFNCCGSWTVTLRSAFTHTETQHVCTGSGDAPASPDMIFFQRRPPLPWHLSSQLVTRMDTKEGSGSMHKHIFSTLLLSVSDVTSDIHTWC